MRQEKADLQACQWIEATAVNGPRNIFCDKLNELLATIDFDRRAEDLREPGDSDPDRAEVRGDMAGGRGFGSGVHSPDSGSTRVGGQNHRLPL